MIMINQQTIFFDATLYWLIPQNIKSLKYDILMKNEP